MLYHLDAKNVCWGTKERMASWLKIICILVSAFAISKNNIQFASVMLIAYVFCDIVDGLFAPLSKDWTDKNERDRRLFDSALDVIIPALYCPYAIYSANMSLLWCVPYIVREGLIVMLAKSALTKDKAVVFPNLVHKGAKLLLAVAGICVLNQWHPVHALILSYSVLFVTLADYYLLFKLARPHTAPTASGYRFAYPKNFGGFRGYFSQYKNTLNTATQARQLLEKKPQNQ